MNSCIKIIAFTLLFLFSEIAFADMMDKKEYEKAVDYINCALTENWLSKLTTDNDKVNFAKIKRRLQSNTIHKPVLYNELSQLLKKNNFAGTDSTLSQKINNKKRISNPEKVDVVSILFDLSKLSQKYADALKEKNDLLKQEIAQEYNLESIVQKEIIEEYPNNNAELKERSKNLETKIATLEDQIQDIKEDLNNPPPKKNPTNPLVLRSSIIALIISALVLLWLVIRYNNLSSKFSTISQYISKFDQQDKERFKISRIESEVASLQNIINEITRNQIPKILLNISEIQTKGIDQSANVQPDILSLGDKRIESKPEEFFMSTPNEDGSFNVNNKSGNIVSSVSLYKFIIDEKNSNRASYAVTEDQMAIRDALNSPYKYLEPVCSIENPECKTGTKILTINEGIAELKGDKWIVSSDKKAKIKFV